jgi:hypothetical protein
MNRSPNPNKDYLSPISQKKFAKHAQSTLKTDMSIPGLISAEPNRNFGPTLDGSKMKDLKDGDQLVYRKFCESILGMLEEIGLLEGTGVRENLKKSWKALKKIVTEYFGLRRKLEDIKRKFGVGSDEAVFAWLEKWYLSQVGAENQPNL